MRSSHSARHRNLQIRKQAAQNRLRKLHPKGLLRLLCAGVAENANQPTFCALPKMMYRYTKKAWSNDQAFVRWARLELAQDYSHYPLKVACLPFHHHRFVCFGIAKVRKILLPPNFSAIFFHFFDVFLQKGAFFRDMTPNTPISHHSNSISDRRKSAPDAIWI